MYVILWVPKTVTWPAGVSIMVYTKGYYEILRLNDWIKS